MEIVIRSLERSDIPDIIELTKNVWGGHDHLPRVIHNWFSDSLCTPIVMNYGDELVAVANLRSVDDGVTGWMEGLRVHPELRGKGLAKQMTLRLVHLAKEQGFSRIRLVTSADNIAPQKLAQSIEMNVIDRLSVFWKRYGRGVKWIKVDDSIHSATSLETLDFIQSNQELFPSNTIAFYWDLHDANERNIQRIDDVAHYFVSESDLGKGFSLGFRNEIPPEPEWCFSVYASSPEVFVSKLHFHLKYAREQGLRDLLCIHKPEFRVLYEDIKWLKRRAHEIDLHLFERVL